jgi:GntR family transcriptional regulator, transcriptional repressor for pyruvate dehydrogenase complex
MFKSLQSDRVSNAIIAQIKDAIFQRKLAVGDKLPSERHLMEQFGASRVTVREALRTLENSGMIEVKRGSEGGAFIRDPNTKFVNNFLQDMFSMGKIRISDLTEARLAVEPFSVRIATERIKDDALEQIRLNIQESKENFEKGNPNDARLLNLEYHRLIAQGSANPVIFFVMDSIMDIMESNISSVILSAKPVEKTIQYHEEIYLAMRTHDDQRAEQIMLKHIQDIQTALEIEEKGMVYDQAVSDRQQSGNRI